MLLAENPPSDIGSFRLAFLVYKLFEPLKFIEDVNVGVNVIDAHFGKRVLQFSNEMVRPFTELPEVL